MGETGANSKSIEFSLSNTADCIQGFITDADTTTNTVLAAIISWDTFGRSSRRVTGVLQTFYMDMSQKRRLIIGLQSKVRGLLDHPKSLHILIPNICGPQNGTKLQKLKAKRTHSYRPLLSRYIRACSTNLHSLSFDHLL
jgi:hypothetical protein